MFTLTFSTANAAFEGEPSPEVVHILREVAERIEQGELEGTVRDSNGNTVGKFLFTAE